MVFRHKRVNTFINEMTSCINKIPFKKIEVDHAKFFLSS